MKKTFMFFWSLGVVLFVISSCIKNDETKNTDTAKNIKKYIDGSHSGRTVQDDEGYIASATIEVNKGLITAVDWEIYDNNRKRYFDSTYQEVYVGNPLYIQQCRDNMAGMIAYGPKLIETQDIDQVDVITGATWSYNQFKSVVSIALKNADQDSTAVTQ
jgi:major membrane immunogen (membrane-anchored lipoprotein)